MFVDHIAVLTQDLSHQSNALPTFCRKQAVMSFPAEGTQEQYVELATGTPKLLLLEPIAPGPYARALQKRGPGLHHIGAMTPSIQALVPELCAQGLLLHPISIQTLKQKVAWLCRPGMPFLIELTEGQADTEVESFALGLPAGSHFPAFVAQLFSNMDIYTAATHGLELKSSMGSVQLLPLKKERAI